jgi:hypothetical protein
VILRDLEADGPFKPGYGSITVIHPARLRALVDND